MDTPSLYSSILSEYLLSINSFSLLHYFSFKSVSIYQKSEIQNNRLCKKQAKSQKLSSKQIESSSSSTSGSRLNIPSSINSRFKGSLPLQKLSMSWCMSCASLTVETTKLLLWKCTTVQLELLQRGTTILLELLNKESYSFCRKRII